MNYSAIPARLAASLLSARGEISLTEIRALPLVDDDDVAMAIADILARDFDVERHERLVSRSPFDIEDVLRLAAPRESSDVT